MNLLIRKFTHLHPTVDIKYLENIPPKSGFHADVIEVDGYGYSLLVNITPDMKTYLAKRGNRKNYSHMTDDAKPILTNKIVVVQDNGVLITAYWSECPSPSEPRKFKTVYSTKKCIQKSPNAFWSTHALIPELGDTLSNITKL